MKISLSTILCLVVLLSAKGQGHLHYVSLPTPSELISETPINLVKVVNRTKSEDIGWVQKGITNKRVTAQLDGGIEHAFDNYITQSTKAHPDAPQVVVVVNEIEISEETKLSVEYGYADLSLVFLLRKEGKDLLITQTNTSLIASGMDVTRKHSLSLAKAIMQCFKQYNEVMNNEPSINIEVQGLDDDLDKKMDLQLKSFPMFTRELQPGLYRKFSEFKKNKPSVTADFEVVRESRNAKKWKGDYGLVPIDKSTKREINNIWGFTYNDTTYVYHRKQFFPLNTEDYKLTFEGFDFLDVDEIVIGGAINAVSEASRAKNSHITFSIDPFSGLIKDPYQRRGRINSSLTQHKLVIYRNKPKQRDESVEVMVNDSTLLSVNVPFYKEISYPASHGSVRLCAGDKCQKVDLEGVEKSYLEILWTKKMVEPILRLQTQEEGAYYADLVKRILKIEE